LKQTSEKFYCRSINTAAIAESLIHEKIIHFIESEHYQGCEVSFLPHKMFGVDIRIMSTNRVVMDKLVDEIALILQENIYGYDGETLIESVTQALLSQKLTISVAESCTGGLLGETFTNIAGSSAFFKGGVICYSDELKRNLVNVSEETLKKFGAVSYEVAEELCRNIARITATDIGVGITGVAGPGGGSKEKPVGLVFIGIFYQNNLYIHEYNLTSDRKTNRELSTTLCLNELRKILIK
jgi:nicotinamide-nucleotide amidase